MNLCCIWFRVGIALKVVAVTFDALVSVAEEVAVLLEVAVAVLKVAVKVVEATVVEGDDSPFARKGRHPKLAPS